MGAPLPRWYASAAYDPILGFLLFGGADSADNKFDDLWALSGSTWTQMPRTGTRPTARSHTGMVFDSDRRRLVVFGGSFGNAHSAETWEFDGTSWSLRATTGPSARATPAMVYDARRRVTVLFGGTGFTTDYNDTWEWDGTVWKQVAMTGPTPRGHGSMVYDSRREVAVLQGGWGTGFFNDTWEWNGSSWSLRPTGVRPSERCDTAAAFDSSRGVMVLYSGSNATQVLNDAWRWNGLTWESDPTFPGAAHTAAAMAYDTVRRRVLLFGGATPPSTAMYNDTWALQE